MCCTESVGNAMNSIEGFTLSIPVFLHFYIHFTVFTQLILQFYFLLMKMISHYYNIITTNNRLSVKLNSIQIGKKKIVLFLILKYL